MALEDSCQPSAPGLFCLTMQSMLPTSGAEFFQLQPVRIIPSIFFRRVIAFIALSAFKRNYRSDSFFSRHTIILPSQPS